MKKATRRCSDRLQFLVNRQSDHLTKELTQVLMQVGEIVGRIYDALLAQPS